MTLLTGSIVGPFFFFKKIASEKGKTVCNCIDHSFDSFVILQFLTIHFLLVILIK